MSLTKANAQQDRHLISGHHSFTLQHPWYKSSVREDVVCGPHLDELCNSCPWQVESLSQACIRCCLDSSPPGQPPRHLSQRCWPSSKEQGSSICSSPWSPGFYLLAPLGEGGSRESYYSWALRNKTILKALIANSDQEMNIYLAGSISAGRISAVCSRTSSPTLPVSWTFVARL